MSYASYINSINSKSTTINDFNTNTSQIDFESIWNGDASKKQTKNLTSIQSELTTQITQLTKLNTAMATIDEYDKNEEELNNYRKQLSELNKNDENYASDYSKINEIIRELTEKKQELKFAANKELNSINKNYSKQLTQINRTELQQTSNLLQQANNNFAKLNFEITVTNSLSNNIVPGDKTTSTNPGSITFDKQGTYYDKEPTPGRSAQKLHVYHDGQRLYDDACITVKKGETIRLTVNLSDNAGEIKQLTRNTASGQGEKKSDPDHWTNWFSAKSEPFVNRHDRNTFLERDNFDWVITADRVTNGYVTLSQTTFHSTDRGNEFKSMYRIRIKVVD